MYLFMILVAGVFTLIFCLTLFPKCGRAERELYRLGQETREASLSQVLDAITQKALNNRRLVGSVVFVSQHGTCIYHKASGYADREHALPMQENTVFRLSSVSKLYTSLAIGVLVTQGKLSFDDTISKWLPYFTPSLPSGEKPIITIRQLLSHTAGLNYRFAESPDGPYHTAEVSDGLDNLEISLEENLRRLASAPLLYEPGKGWCYSLSIDVLGGVIESVTGKNLPSAMQQLIENPLELKGSGYFFTDRERLAVPYYNSPSGEPLRIQDSESIDIGIGRNILFTPERIFNEKAFPSGGGGMSGTAFDVMALLEVVRQKGMPIISSEVMQEMNKEHVARVGRPGWGHALGWQILSDPAKAKSPQAKGTLNWSGVYGHSWFVDPTNDLCVAILTNTTPEGLSGKYVTKVCEAIYSYSN